jgi:hypothetical protein
MTPHKNVFTALAAAQGEMGPLVKGATNPHFKSRYATLDDVVNAVRPPLNANGLCFHFETRDGEMVAVLTHGESETNIKCGIPLLVSKNDIQAYKSATTYAKRMGLESITGIAPADDDDGTAAAKAPPRPDMAPPKAKQPQPSDAASEAEMETAVAFIKQMTSIDLLASYWKGLVADAPHVSKMPAVIAAKDGQKLALSRTADLAGDSIPY